MAFANVFEYLRRSSHLDVLEKSEGPEDRDKLTIHNVETNTVFS